MKDNEEFEIDLDKLEMINVEKQKEEEAEKEAESEPTYVKNPAYARNILESVLSKYPEHFNHLMSNQFAIVQKAGKKPSAKGAVKPVKLLKGGERLFYAENAECKDARFYLEVDKLSFMPLDEEDQEKAIFRQLCKIFYDMEKEKYVILGPDAEIYLAMVRVYGNKLDEVINVNRALSVSDDEDEDDD